MASSDKIDKTVRPQAVEIPWTVKKMISDLTTKPSPRPLDKRLEMKYLDIKV